MDRQPKSAKARVTTCGKLSRSRAVRSSSSPSSSSSSSSGLSSSSDKDDAAADEESRDFGSRIQLFSERRKSSSSSSAKKKKKRQKKLVETDEKEDSIETVVEKDQQIQQQQESIEKEKETATASTSIAQTIKKRFGFFRRSESVRSANAENIDVEAALTTKKKESDKESLIESKIDDDQDDSTRVLDVVADVHVENEKPTKKQERSSLSSTSSSPEIVAIESSSPVEQHTRRRQRRSGDSDDNIEEIGSIGEARPTSGRRKRWDKPAEKVAGNATEKLLLEEQLKNKKPRRRQWAKGGAASAEIRDSSGQKILLPERSATAEPVVRPASSRLRSRPPIAAPRSRDPRGRDESGAFDNEAFSSDHDEVLRIETIDDRSPTIKMSNGSEYNDDSATLSEEDEEEEDKRLPSDRKSSIEKAEIQDFTAPSTTATTTTTESSEIQDSPRNKIVSSRRSSRSSARRKSSGGKRSSGGRDGGDQDDDFDEDEEDDQETTTVLTAMERGGKSRRSSRSSSKRTPVNFFEKRRGRSSGDETTTITTNEDMHTSRRDSRRSRKSKSESSSRRRDKLPTTSSSTTRYSGDELQQRVEQPQKPPRKSRSKSKRRSRRKKSDEQSTAVATATDVDDEDEEGQRQQQQLRYASIRIHRSDMLEADYLTRRPMVKVHLVYAETGEYPRSRGSKQPNDEQQPVLLQPIVTDRFDFRAKRSMVPVWEQELVFEFNYKHLLAQGRAAVVLLFEIIDRVNNGGDNDGSFDRNNTRDPYWYKVAWAFLRPIGVNGARHVDKRVRLQLYRPKKAFWRSTITTRINNRNSKTTRCELYKWWKSSSRVKYPSSLYVTVCGVEPPTPRLLESVRMTGGDTEQPLRIDDLTDFNNEDDNDNEKEKKNGCRALLDEETRPKWTRHAAQSCQIPNDLAWETETSERGCFALAFSHDGKYLACACSEEYDYPILVYKLDDGKISMRFAGHKNFVYSVNWSRDDRQLVTCSSDQTARLWDVAEKIIEPRQALPHPSYVYCCRFVGGDNDNSIVTGCYDHVARVWSRRSSETNYELIQELEGHESFVSAVACSYGGGDNETNQLITGDGAGTLIVWLWAKRRTPKSRRRGSAEWQMSRKLRLKDLEGVTINTLVSVGGGATAATRARLLVHSRDDELRLLEPATGHVLRHYVAPQLHRNRRIQARACVSPCGGLLFCGGEASRLCAWALDTGRLLASYELSDIGNNRAVTCVDYHPYDHALAYSVYGAPGEPVRVLRYDREADGSRVGLKLLATQQQPTMMSVNSLARFKLEPMRTQSNNGSATRSLTSQNGHAAGSLARFGRVDDSAGDDDDDDDESRSRQQQQLKGRVQNFMETGPSLRAKSLSRLSGIIEKIDRILMYATSHHHQQQQQQRSSAIIVDVEAARRADDQSTASASKLFTVTQRNPSPVEIIELKDLPSQKQPHRKRSKSARNACSPTLDDLDSAKAFFSDGNHRNHHHRRYSRGGSDDSTSNRSIRRQQRAGQFVFETMDLDRIEDNNELQQQQQQQQRKDSLDTIVDGREDFPSEEVLDVESLKSDDTYVVNKDDDGSTMGINKNNSNNNNKNSNNNNGDGSDRSNATFVIENEIVATSIPVPKPRRKIGRIELAR